MSTLPTDADAAGEWMKRERERRDWSTIKLADRARAIARREGSALKLTQQTISGFEQPGKKRIPEWLQYVRMAFEEEDGRPSGHAKAPDIPPTRSADAGETVEIIQLDLSLSMGPGTLIEDFVESELVAFDASVLRRITRTPSTRLRFVTGIGNSHEPKFQNNDQFLIDINERQLSRLDAYYWITLHGAHALKRLRPLGKGRIQVISENPDFEPQDVDADDIRIEGRAIWFARGL